LPTERDLCLRFNSSRITIRRALQILEEEMLVQRRQGSGTFVSPTPSRKIPLLSTDFFGSIVRHAPKLRRKLDHHEWKPAPQATADQLNVLPGERILYARRIDLLSGTPVCVDEIHLLERFADRLSTDDLADLNFGQRWPESQGFEMDYGTQIVEAVPAAKPITGFLDVKAREPLLKETNVMYAVGGRAAGLFESYYRHQYFRLNTTFRFAESALISSPSERG
jgi:DNA-binding GntR family transcriptional regulator